LSIFGKTNFSKLRKNFPQFGGSVPLGAEVLRVPGIIISDSKLRTGYGEGAFYAEKGKQYRKLKLGMEIVLVSWGHHHLLTINSLRV